MPTQTQRVLCHCCGRDLWRLQQLTLGALISLVAVSQNSYYSSYSTFNFNTLSHTDQSKNSHCSKQVGIQPDKKIFRRQPD